MQTGYNPHMYLVAGLGNPTKKYDKTRHNMGFDVIDKLALKLGAKMKISRFTARVGKTEIAGEQVLLVKPQTFMNLSGEAILRIANYYKVDIEKELIVIYDDTDINIGSIRIKGRGSAGGHNGMKSIIACLKTEEFTRIRVGIGSKENDSDMVDFVLGHFDKKDREEIEKAQDSACDAVEDIIAHDVEYAMNKYN